MCLPKSSGPLREAVACETTSRTLKNMANKPFTRLKLGASATNVKFATASKIANDATSFATAAPSQCRRGIYRPRANLTCHADFQIIVVIPVP